MNKSKIQKIYIIISKHFEKSLPSPVPSREEGAQVFHGENKNSLEISVADTERENFVCAQELHRKCNYMYVDSLRNHKNMADYYRCYVDGYKECPSRVLDHLTQVYRQALTEGSPVDQMFKQLQKVFAALAGKSSSSAH